MYIYFSKRDYITYNNNNDDDDGGVVVGVVSLDESPNRPKL